MKTSNISQSDLAAHYSSGRNVVFAFRAAYLIKRTDNTTDGIPAYGLNKVYTHRGSLPLTQRGRFVVISPMDANDVIPIFLPS